MIFEIPERCGSTGRAVDKDEDDLSVQVVFEDGSDGWFAIASLCRPGASARTAGDSEQVRRAVFQHAVDVCQVFIQLCVLSTSNEYLNLSIRKRSLNKSRKNCTQRLCRKLVALPTSAVNMRQKLKYVSLEAFLPCTPRHIGVSYR